MMRFWMIAAALLLTTAACTDDTNDTDALDCGPGASSTLEGTRTCIIDNDLLIETGFNCDPTLERYEGAEVTICAEGELSQEALQGVMGFAPEPITPGLSVLGPFEIEASACEEAQEKQSPLSLRNAGEEEDGFEVAVTHAGVEANCCAVFESVTATLDTDTQTATLEYSIDDSNPCDCTCFYTLDYKITGMPAGEWSFTVDNASATIALE